MRYAIRLRAAGKRQHLLSGVNSWPCSRRLHSARFGSVEDAVDALATIVRQFPGDFDSCQVLDGDKVIRRWSPAKGHLLIWDLADAEVWRNGREDTMSKRATIRINRNAGTIEATGADGVSDGIIYIVPDGNGWGRTALNGARVAAYDPDRNRLIDNVIAMLSERTPCDVIEVGERPTQYA